LIWSTEKVDQGTRDISFFSSPTIIKLRRLWDGVIES
jgi:hypothetical protein